MVEDSNRARDHLANERTFLAWVRTSVAIVVFGFAIGRFAIAMRQLTEFQGHGSKTTGFSVWMGMSAILAGVALMVAGLARYRKTRAQLDEGKFEAGGIYCGSGGDCDCSFWIGAGGVFDLRAEEFGLERRSCAALSKQSSASKNLWRTIRKKRRRRGRACSS